VFIEAKDDGGGGNNWTTGAISCAKLQSNHHHQHPVFLQARCPSCRPTNSVKALRENITFHGLDYRNLTWGLPTLSLTTNSSWLPRGRVALPLISPLMRVSVCCQGQCMLLGKLEVCYFCNCCQLKCDLIL